VRRESVPISSRAGRPAWIAGMFLLAGLALTPVMAAAQEAARWEVSAFAGGFFGSRTYTSESLEIFMASVPTYGLRLGYRVSRNFSLEAAWSRAESSLDPVDPVTGAPAEPSTPVLVNTYEVDALYWFGKGKVRGYLGMGGGIMHLNPSVATLDRASSAQFVASFDVGGTFSLGSRFALRADARYRWRGGRTRVGAVICYPDGECQPFTTNIFSTAEITGGLTYRF
jgi:hypothetical protein